MTQMVDRQNAHWRIIYNGKRGSIFPYHVQYKIERMGWVDWDICQTRMGARYVLWRARRVSKPIGGEMVIYEEKS